MTTPLRGTVTGTTGENNAVNNQAVLDAELDQNAEAFSVAQTRLDRLLAEALRRLDAISLFTDEPKGAP